MTPVQIPVQKHVVQNQDTIALTMNVSRTVVALMIKYWKEIVVWKGHSVDAHWIMDFTYL